MTAISEGIFAREKAQRPEPKPLWALLAQRKRLRRRGVIYSLFFLSLLLVVVLAGRFIFDSSLWYIDNRISIGGIFLLTFILLTIFYFSLKRKQYNYSEINHSIDRISYVSSEKYSLFSRYLLPNLLIEIRSYSEREFQKDYNPRELLEILGEDRLEYDEERTSRILRKIHSIIEIQSSLHYNITRMSYLEQESIFDYIEHYKLVPESYQKELKGIFGEQLSDYVILKNGVAVLLTGDTGVDQKIERLVYQIWHRMDEMINLFKLYGLGYPVEDFLETEVENRSSNP